MSVSCPGGRAVCRARDPDFSPLRHSRDLVRLHHRRPGHPEPHVRHPVHSLGDREKAWDTFGVDAEWLKVREESIARGRKDRGLSEPLDLARGTVLPDSVTAVLNKSKDTGPPHAD